jgi:2-polyprenyl-3-methyl-5-hydroxy-6-metoxy-1,4-benzoquinol methylase
MKKPIYESNWQESWKLSYKYDLMEVFGDTSDLSYSYEYKHRFNKAINAVKKYIPSHARIIDVAAAQGNFSLYLAELGYSVTWNDIRTDLAEYVKIKYETGDINYLPGNCFELNLQEEFDAVLITEIIEHVAHPDLFLLNISKLVKPGGYIIMTTPNGESIRNILPRFSECSDPSIFEDSQFKPDADGHIFLLHRDEIKSIVKGSGLILKELFLFNSLLASGLMKTSYISSFIPKFVVDLLEFLTSFNGGHVFSKFNKQTLAIIEKPKKC